MRSAVGNSDQQIADTVPTAVLMSDRGGQLADSYGKLRVRAADWLLVSSYFWLEKCSRFISSAVSNMAFAQPGYFESSLITSNGVRPRECSAK